MKHRRRRPILFLLWFAISIMACGVILFMMHKEGPFSDWTIDYWALIISIFSALFSGLNVLAFYHLTIAVEQQNDERQEKALRIDGLKYQLERQQSIFDKIDQIRWAYVSSERSTKWKEIKELKELDRLVNVVKSEQGMLQILYNCNALFPSVSKDSVQSILKIYEEGEKKWIKEMTGLIFSGSGVADDTVIEQRCAALSDFWDNNNIVLNAHFTLIVAQMQYDMQVSLAESLGQETPQKPEWKNEQGVITALNQLPIALNQSREKKAIPEIQLIRWDFTYLDHKEKTNE